MIEKANWTFKRYLQVCREVNTPQGDFTRDVLADGAFPDTTKWPDVRDNLRGQGASPDAIAAAASVFAQYRKGARLRAGRPNGGSA